MTTVNEIYEIVKSHNFHQEMWFDVLSCISEMPTYKRLKDMVNSILTRGPENLNFQPSDNLPTMFPELTIMAFTIDGIVIEVLRKKLKDEWAAIVSKVVEECKQDMNGNLVSTHMLEDIESIFSAKEGVDVCIPPKKVSHKESLKKTTTKSSQKELSSKQPVVVLNRIDSQNDNPPLMAAHNSDFGGMVAVATIDSDLDKDVSSVHTSDLSSFEDEISISSDDGIEKFRRTVPLKIASELYTQNKLPEIYKSLEKMNDLKDKMTPPKKRWKNNFNAIASGSGIKTGSVIISQTSISLDTQFIPYFESMTLKKTKKKKS